MTMPSIVGLVEISTLLSQGRYKDGLFGQSLFKRVGPQILSGKQTLPIRPPPRRPKPASVKGLVKGLVFRL
jgi:hypothetical protein